MDQAKIGSLLRMLRQQLKMTQKELADKLGVSDKTVSKWECGQGCPDLATLPDLAAILGVSLENLLTGELSEQSRKGDNMKNLKFYVCPQCGNVVTSSGSPALSCCGRVLEALGYQKPNEEHELTIEEIDGEWFLTAVHPMEKSHSLMFAALVTAEQVILVRRWPEWDFQVRLPKRGHGLLYWYCTKHGLFRQII